jgi:DnaJ homolog subfamily C member 2
MTDTVSTITLFHSFDTYVSELVGEEISTGVHEIDISGFSEEFHAKLAVDLEEQRMRFAAEDAKLAEYIASLPSDKTTATSSSTTTKATTSTTNTENPDEEEEEFDESLLELDPVEYRKHDLYKVLGLEKRRWLATPEELKAAYRRRVVRHHPDKLKQNPRSCALRNPNLEDDSFFKLIQKAWQVLTDPGRKADYEACDPTFDESVPEDREYATVEEFCAAFGPVFERNARFSKKQPTPTLGDVSSARSHVDAFYSFWINIDSWRRFEWLDEDEPAGTDNRADKRWHEKKNKAKRDTRKKEDNSRLIRLVETAMKRDPRMVAWKEADRIAKAVKKNSKADAARAAKDAEVAAKAAKAEIEAKAQLEAKALNDAKAAQKATAKTALKASRKAFRETLGSVELWARDLVAEIRAVQALGLAIEKLVSTIGDDTRRLDRATSSIASLLSACNNERSGNLSKLSHLLESLEVEGDVVEATSTSDNIPSDNTCDNVPTTTTNDNIPSTTTSDNIPTTPTTPTTTWNTLDIDILIAAVKQFPGGTQNRWEQITNSLNRQLANTATTPTTCYSIDQVIAQANSLIPSTNAPASSDEAQTLAALNSSKKKRDPRVDMAEPTIAAHYFDTSATTCEETCKENHASIWTPEDQTALETALKTVPADHENRWDSVAELVPGKSKKECLIRVKEIATILKSSKK